MTRLFILALFMMATPVLAQVLTPAPPLVCWPRDEFLKSLEVKYEERAFFSGIELTTKIPFTFYVNTRTGTSSYVTFPMKGTACVRGGEQVIFAPREPDL